MLAEIAVMPVCGEKSLSRYVAEVVRYIKEEADKRGLKYELTSMATLIEGKDEDVWEILKGCHETIRQYSDRVYTIIHIDDKKGRTDALQYKKSRIEDILHET